MTVQELREKSVADLQSLLATERQTLQELRFKASEMQLKEVHKINTVKNNIARILTVLAEQRKQSTEA